MKNVIIKTGSQVSPVEIDDVQEKLKKGVYTLEFNNLKGFYLNQVENLTLPEKMYGDLSVIDKYLKCYHSRPRNLGVLLSGQKGSGKTLTAKALAIKSGLPIIMINNSFPDCPASYVNFLCNPALGDCVLFFDEFEKVFDNSDPDILTLLDGPQNSHHLCILTINNVDQINPMLLNRPSRIFYQKNYDGLEPEVLEDLCNDILINKDFKTDFIQTCDKILDLSFDIALALLHDVNLFNEPASVCVKDLSISRPNTYLAIYQEHNGRLIDITDSNQTSGEDDIELFAYSFPEGEEIHSYSLDKYTSAEVHIPMDKLTKIGKGTYEYTTLVTFFDFNKARADTKGRLSELRDEYGNWTPEAEEKYSTTESVKFVIKVTQYRRYTY